MFRYLDKQPLASTLAELQAQIDAFDEYYNNERPHQGLPGRVTPRTAREATPKAEAPHPKPDPTFLLQPAARRFQPAPPPKDLPTGTHVTTLTSAGGLRLAGITYQVDGRRGFEQVLVVIDGDTITVADLDGEVLIEHTRPAPGVRYVGNGRPRGPRQDR